MADIENRESFENRLAGMLALIWANEGEPFWRRFLPSPRLMLDRIDKAGIQQVVTELNHQQAGNFFREVGWFDSTATFIRSIPSRIENWMFGLGQRLANFHRDWLVKHDIARVVGTEPPGFEILYPEHQAQREAITSVTTTATETELSGRAWLEREHGVQIETIWRLDPQSNWCKVCLGLADTPERIWSKQFPKGTPAHPVCRCFLEHYPVVSLNR